MELAELPPSERVCVVSPSDSFAEDLARDLAEAGVGLQVSRAGAVVEIQPCACN